MTPLRKTVVVLLFAVLVARVQVGLSLEGADNNENERATVDAAPGNVTPDETSPQLSDEFLKAQAMCGPNATYLLLGMHGIEADYEDVTSSFDVAPDGVSLLSVKQGLNRFGLESEILKCADEDLDRLPTPFILYTSSIRPPIISGHFVIVTDVEPTALRIVDSTYGGEKVYQRAKLSNVWDGIVVVPRSDELPLWETVFCVAALLFCLIVWRMTPAPRGQPPVDGGSTDASTPSSATASSLPTSAPLIATLAFASLTIGGALLAADPEEAADPPAAEQAQIWRIPGRDPVNSLYMLMRLHGYSGSYEEFLRQAEPLEPHPSMASLQGLANQLGYPIQVRKTSLEQIIDNQELLPAVIHSDVIGEEVGKYSLLVYANKDQLGMLDSETMWLTMPSHDEFRESWTGYILTYTPERPPWLSAMTWLSCVLCATAIGTLLLSRGGRSKNGIPSPPRA